MFWIACKTLEYQSTSYLDVLALNEKSTKLESQNYPNFPSNILSGSIKMHNSAMNSETFKSALDMKSRSKNDSKKLDAHSKADPLNRSNTRSNRRPSKSSRAKSDDLETLLPDRSLPSIPDRSKMILAQPSTGYHIIDTSDEEGFSLSAAHSLLLPRLEETEAEFLQLTAEDNVAGVREHIRNHPDLNINCINFQGLSALHLAVGNRSEAMVELLLSQPDIDIADTVLHAVRDNQLRITKLLLDAQKALSPGLEFAGVLHSTDFPDHVTPLMLAAQSGHYEAVALLMERGHRLERPHPPNCTCPACKTSMAQDDPLQASSARLALYRAVVSPAYIVHAAPDPILVAFRLSAELEANAAANRQLAAAYLQLRDDVSAFAVELIGCCRTSDETELLMRQTSGSRGRRHFIFPRLLMAMDYRQKEFVAHPNTQQVLESFWLGDWYGWRGKSALRKAAIMVLRVFITPGILFICMVMPRHKLVKHFQIPLNKLITHAAAYFVFLVIVFIISDRDKTDQTRGPPKTGAEGPLVLYVCGYAWSAVRLCVTQGPRRYFTELWNWGEIVMLALFALTFLLWAAAALDVTINDKADLERKYWNQFDPTLLAEGTFCVATIIAYFRLMFLCQLNYHLGPLQVSLGKMTIDIYKYIIVFAIIISAFAVGLARFYQYYDGMIYTDEAGMKTVQVSSFTSLSDTLNTLFWALFCMSPIESADVVLENAPAANSTAAQAQENRHAFTEKVGYMCFACFEVISVIVVLNMLIATMSNTFQKVTDNVAIEWTFGRTEVYVDYISQTTLPSPYNLIPTASGMASMLEWFRTYTRKPRGARAKWSLSYCCYIERDLEESRQKEFPLLMSLLVQRYFRDKESSYASGGGVEGELEALRRDLAALKTILLAAGREK